MKTKKRKDKMREYIQRCFQPKEKAEQKIQETYLSGYRQRMGRYRAQSDRQTLSQAIP